MAEESPSRAMAQRKRSGATTIVIVIVIVVLAGAVGGWYLFLRRGPEQVAQEFLAAATAGDLERLKLTLTEDSVKYLEVPEVRKVLEQIMVQLRVQQPVCTVEKVTVEGVGAQVEFKLTDPARPETKMLPVIVVLEKQGGKWGVQLLRTIKETFKYDLGAAVSRYLRSRARSGGR